MLGHESGSEEDWVSDHAEGHTGQGLATSDFRDGKSNCPAKPQQ